MANPCSTCAGCGKLDNKSKKPWSQADRKAVLAGEIEPVVCPTCNATGEAAVAEPTTPAK